MDKQMMYNSVAAMITSLLQVLVHQPQHMRYMFIVSTTAVLVLLGVQMYVVQSTVKYRPEPGLALLMPRDDPLWMGGWSPPAPLDPGSSLKLCPLTPPGIGIFVPINLTEVTYDALRSLYPMVQKGGYYAPAECRAHNKTVIVIPYRDRKHNLLILLRNLIPFLIRQQAEFRIFVAEQTAEYEFNKGALLNVAYLAARRLWPQFTCFMFHDTDYVPMDYRNLYRCRPAPKHLLISRTELLHLGMKYRGAFGGVITFSRPMFEAVNGFSNLYYGWGSEDDDLRRRYEMNNISFTRNDVVIGTYRNIPHPKEKTNTKRKSIFRKLRRTWMRDGLKDVFKNRIRTVEIMERQLFTHILVAVKAPPQNFYGQQPLYPRNQSSKINQTLKHTLLQDYGIIKYQNFILNSNSSLNNSLTNK